MKRAQASTEALIIVAAVLVSLLILIVMLLNIGMTSQNIYDDGIVRTATNDLADNALIVWHQGEGARQRVYLQLPDGVTNISTQGEHITLTRGIAGNEKQYTRALSFNVTGNLSITRSGYWVIVERSGGLVVIRASD
jgi:uncharacterized protein (UPF0333 family)